MSQRDEVLRRMTSMSSQELKKIYKIKLWFGGCYSGVDEEKIFILLFILKQILQ